ncbi:MAG: 3-phosphoshikimate 1-carboxyvinyltransferase [Alphaproteobacteria bacterium]
MTALVSEPVERLAGDVAVPGDKSISHRALMIGAVAVGETVITGLLEGDDVRRTAGALRAMGVACGPQADGAWHVQGLGVGGFRDPDDVLDMGNSGTGARLLMGLVATQPISAHFTGDASLRGRPMGRISEPVIRMGARVIAREGGRMPLVVIGARDALPISYALPVASAQVKSAVLLAGLNAPGTTRVIEPRPSRDHTELMLRHFGAEITVEPADDGGRVITLTGQPELTARPVTVPGDPSSAAFPAVAALIAGGGGGGGDAVAIPNVGLNPLRAGLYETLVEMGADITITNRRAQAGEPVGDLNIRASRLRGITVPAARAPAMIDEYPILAVAAACAEGETRMCGLAELRVKESDRLAAIADGLAACGVGVEIDGDDLIVQGAGGAPPGGGRIEARMDHRIAMAFLVLGIAARAPVTVDDASHIATSFPGFVELMGRIGARISPANGG